MEKATVSKQFCSSEMTQKKIESKDLFFQECGKYLLNCPKKASVGQSLRNKKYVPGSKLPKLGINSSHLKNRNPYNRYINPYGIGLMSLSPIILWKSWDLIDPIARMATENLPFFGSKSWLWEIGTRDRHRHKICRGKKSRRQNRNQIRGFRIWHPSKIENLLIQKDVMF